jgi:hypothetical protein
MNGIFVDKNYSAKHRKTTFRQRIRPGRKKLPEIQFVAFSIAPKFRRYKSPLLPASISICQLQGRFHRERKHDVTEREGQWMP